MGASQTPTSRTNYPNVAAGAITKPGTFLVINTTSASESSSINFGAMRDAIDWYRVVGQNEIADKYEGMFAIELAAVNTACA